MDDPDLDQIIRDIRDDIATKRDLYVEKGVDKQGVDYEHEYVTLVQPGCLVAVGKGAVGGPVIVDSIHHRVRTEEWQGATTSTSSDHSKNTMTIGQVPVRFKVEASSGRGKAGFKGSGRNARKALVSALEYAVRYHGTTVQDESIDRSQERKDSASAKPSSDGSSHSETRHSSTHVFSSYTITKVDESGDQVRVWIRVTPGRLTPRAVATTKNAATDCVLGTNDLSSDLPDDDGRLEFEGTPITGKKPKSTQKAGAPSKAGKTGTIKGAVDLPGATVEVVGHGSYTTAARGTFEFRDLPAGSHKVIVRAEGYDTVEKTVTVWFGRPADVDIGLTESVRASGDLPNAPNPLQALLGDRPAVGDDQPEGRAALSDLLEDGINSDGFSRQLSDASPPVPKKRVSSPQSSKTWMAWPRLWVGGTMIATVLVGLFLAQWLIDSTPDEVPDFPQGPEVTLAPGIGASATEAGEVTTTSAPTTTEAPGTTVAPTITDPPVLRTDGIYVAAGEECTEYLRFFDASGTVFSTCSTGSPGEVAIWLMPGGSIGLSTGGFAIDGIEIDFTVTVPELQPTADGGTEVIGVAGTIDNTGTIGVNSMTLSSYSNITSYAADDRVFEFFPDSG